MPQSCIWGNSKQRLQQIPFLQLARPKHIFLPPEILNFQKYHTIVHTVSHTVAHLASQLAYSVIYWWYKNPWIHTSKAMVPTGYQQWVSQSHKYSVSPTYFSRIFFWISSETIIALCPRFLSLLSTSASGPVISCTTPFLNLCAVRTWVWGKELESWSLCDISWLLACGFISSLSN